MKMAKIKPFEEYTIRYEDWFERNKFVYRSELQAIRIQLPELWSKQKKNYKV